MPNAPENVRLRKGTGDFDLNLTWDAPNGTQNNGALDGDINYTIIRYPGEIVVAENYTGNSFNQTLKDTGGIVKYYYDVIAYGGSYKGATATSNSVALGMASVPYKETFDSKDALDTFTILNANNDDQTWEWYEGSNWISKISYVRCKYSLGYTTPMDDWLITPGIKLEKGYYKAIGIRDESKIYVEFYQSQFLMGRIEVTETKEDYGEEELNFAKILPYNDSHVKFIFGSLDFNAYAFVPFL